MGHQTKFKNKYRIASSRLQSWDYRWNGAYFITICTKDKEPLLGEIRNNIMKMSPVGIIADILLHEIKNHTENVAVADYVVMPNHVHGLFILSHEGVYETNQMNAAETLHATSLRHPPASSLKNKSMSAISPESGSVSTIVRSYKSAVTKHARRLGFEFEWQTRFHDHIIRNDKSFLQIREYIKNNPKRWESDKFYTESRQPAYGLK